MLYNCKIDGDHYRITKFTPDLEVESSYLTSDSECDCPAGHRHTCRHRQMLPRFIDKSATRGQWFLDFDRDHWVRAVGEVEFEPYIALEGAQAGSLAIGDMVTLPADTAGEDVAGAFARMQGPLGIITPAHGFTMLDLASTQPHSPTVTTAEFDSVDGGSTPPVVTTAPKSDLRRI